MANRAHLPKAPIVEGLIDFRVRAQADVAPSEFDSATEQLGPGYSRQSPIFRREVMVEVPAGGAPTTSAESTAIGIRYHSSDEKYVAQFTIEGFTLSRLRPYESWDALLSEAKRLWEIYSDVVKPQSISRAAVRFINNLQLPLQAGQSFEDYLLIAPRLPEALPQGLAGFLQRLVVVNPEIEAQANVTLSLEAASGDRLPVMFDIDVYRTAGFDRQSEDAWDCLNRLRHFKNDIFFESLTQRAIELYQ